MDYKMYKKKSQDLTKIIDKKMHQHFLNDAVMDDFAKLKGEIDDNLWSKASILMCDAQRHKALEIVTCFEELMEIINDNEPDPEARQTLLRLNRKCKEPFETEYKSYKTILDFMGR